MSPGVPEPKGAAELRERAKAHIAEASERLEGSRPARAALTPEDSPARALNLPSIAYLGNGLNYEDSDLANDLTLGMGVTGEIPAANTVKPRTRAQRVDLDEWEARIPQSNRVSVDRVMVGYGVEGGHRAMAPIYEVGSAGADVRTNPPYAGVMSTIPLTPRFDRPERHGVGEVGEIRLIDDFKASGVNDLLSSVDTCVPNGDRCVSHYGRTP